MKCLRSVCLLYFCVDFLVQTKQFKVERSKINIAKIIYIRVCIMLLFICIHVDFGKQSLWILKNKTEQKKTQNSQKSPKSCNPVTPDGPKTCPNFPVVLRIMLCFTSSSGRYSVLRMLIHSKWLNSGLRTSSLTYSVWSALPEAQPAPRVHSSYTFSFVAGHSYVIG